MKETNATIPSKSVPCILLRSFNVRHFKVATTTRQYINGLVAPGVLGAADNGGVAEQIAEPSVSSSAVAGAPVPSGVDGGAPTVVFVGDGKDEIPVEHNGGDGC